MDPNANLSEMLEIARRGRKFYEADEESDIWGDCDASRMCELFLALDDWLSKGGFPPARWRQP